MLSFDINKIFFPLSDRKTAERKMKNRFSLCIISSIMNVMYDTSANTAASPSETPITFH